LQERLQARAFRITQAQRNEWSFLQSH